MLNTEPIWHFNSSLRELFASTLMFTLLLHGTLPAFTKQRRVWLWWNMWILGAIVENHLSPWKLHLLEQFRYHLVWTKAECVAFIFSGFLKLEPLEAVLLSGISEGSSVGCIQKMAFKDIYIVSVRDIMSYVCSISCNTMGNSNFPQWSWASEWKTSTLNISGIFFSIFNKNFECWWVRTPFCILINIAGSHYYN